MVFARRCILVPYRKNREMQKGREGRVKEKYWHLCIDGYHPYYYNLIFIFMDAEGTRFRENNPEAAALQDKKSSDDLRRLVITALVAIWLFGGALYLRNFESTYKTEEVPEVVTKKVWKILEWEGSTKN
jgi:hypothetical protein